RAASARFRQSPEGDETMIAELTGAERRTAMLIGAGAVLVGLLMAVAGQGDPMGVHGWIVLLAGAVAFFLVGNRLSDPEPAEDRLGSYYDDPTKAGIVLSLAWAVFAMGMGIWVAAQLPWPELRFAGAWSSFGRLRPVHARGVIFGFGGNALIAASCHVMQRTSRARRPDQLSRWFVLLGYNLFVILAVTGYPMGITPSKEYAEPEW